MALDRSTLGLMLMALLAGCDESEKWVWLSARVESVDESVISWKELRFSLACWSTLKEDDLYEDVTNVVYQVGDEYLTQIVGPDRQVSIPLPPDILERWVGRIRPVLSCSFRFVAFNDANGNMKLDLGPVDIDPHVLLWEATSRINGVAFVVDADKWNTIAGRAEEVSRGWKQVKGLNEFSSDFDRQLVLTPQKIAGP